MTKGFIVWLGHLYKSPNLSSVFFILSCHFIYLLTFPPSSTLRFRSYYNPWNLALCPFIPDPQADRFSSAFLGSTQQLSLCFPPLTRHVCPSSSLISHVSGKFVFFLPCWSTITCLPPAFLFFLHSYLISISSLVPCSSQLAIKVKPFLLSSYFGLTGFLLLPLHCLTA